METYSGPQWPFHLRFALMLLGVGGLCYVAWRTGGWPRDSSLRRAGRVLLWSLLAVAAWLSLPLLYALGPWLDVDLPGASWEHVPGPKGAWDLIRWTLAGSGLWLLLFGLPLATLAALASWARASRRARRQQR